MKVLTEILMIVQEEKVPRPFKQYEVLKNITSLPEVVSGQECEDIVTHEFNKRFDPSGTKFPARAKNISKFFIDYAWDKYNNYKSVAQVITIDHIKVAMKTSPDAKKVEETVKYLIDQYVTIRDERTYNSARMDECTKILSAAMDWIKMITPPGVIYDMLDKAASKVTAYERKFAFLLERDKDKAPPPEEKAVYEAFKEEELKYKLDTSSTTSLFYEGPPEFASIEANVSICKLYLEVFDKLYTATRGMQKFKTHWVNGAARRQKRRLKLQKFLKEAKSDYMKEKTANHVEIVWKKFLKRDTILRKTQDIIDAAIARREAIDEALAGIDKYGWEEVTDEDGVVYFYDTTRREESSYEKPVYKFKDNIAVKVMQRLARLFLEKLAELRRLKEAARLKEIEMMGKKMQLSLQAVRTSVTFSQRDLEALVKDGIQHKDEDVSIESLMPWSLRLSKISNPRPGVWALMQLKNNLFSYESVVIFKIRKSKNKMRCSVKNIKGEITKEVDLNKLLEMNYDKELEIECRPKRQLFYYKAYINKIKMTHLGEIIYDVRYKDGDFEENMSREYIRPGPEALMNLGSDRQKVFQSYKNQKIRKDHFLAIKHKRLDKLQRSLIQNGGSFATAWADMNARNSKRQRNIQTLSDNVVNMKELFSSSASITYAKMEPTLKIFYSRTCTKFGWEKALLANGKIGYKNLQETSEEAPRYSPEEQFSVIKMQSAWRTKLVNDRIKVILIQNPLHEIALKAIDDYKKEAFIGYHYEGVNPALLLCRLGLWDVAANVINFYKDRVKELQSINALEFMDCPKEQYKIYGIVQFEDVKKFTDLQMWWKRLSVEKRDEALRFINYYSSYDDPRSITKCIRESEEKILQILITAFPSSSTRTRQSAKIIFESLYPHSQKQIDTLIKKYADNPELFREKLIELKNKPTTHTWEEEEKAFKILNRACFKISALLARMKLKNMKSTVDKFRDKANDIIENISDKRVPSSGPEARAALILRSEVLTYILECSKAVVIIQKVIRGFCKRNNFRTRRRNRYKAVTAIQRCFRCNKARQLARKLRRLQKAPWEQLWDKSRNMMYYYNRTTNVSQYLEPSEDFRPLVRDRRSSALMQAWPFLDSDATRYVAQTSDQNIAAAVTVPSNIPDLKLCDTCKVRKCCRLCLDCGAARGLTTNMVSNVVPFCFPCYNQLHSDDLSFRNHRYSDTTERNVVALSCTICEQAATRKCQGILNEATIEDILDQIQVARPENWNKILKKANICDDRKISMLLQNIKALHRDSKIILTPAELQHIRTTLERLRAECDECYCSACYIDSHSGGRRSLHKWIGFNPNAAVCSICLRSPGEKTCQDCDNSAYCNSCFKVFHGMGKKRKHRNHKLLEEMLPSDVLCGSCDRRAGYFYCSNPGCDFMGCDSCYECIHVAECKFIPDGDVVDENAPYIAPGAPICTVCSYPADTKCNRCGDFYCSRVWMGNEGCFQQHHSKGFRISHRQITLEVPKEDWEQYLEE